MQLSYNQEAFLVLVRAGLWEQDVRLFPFSDIDFNEVYRLAEEQSVCGLVAAGLEHVQDVIAPQEVLLQFIGQSLQLEQRNRAMNSFIAEHVDNMRKMGIDVLLVKGQGVAQCYEKPLWRSSGDVDLLLNEDNYCKAKEYLLSLSSGNKKEERYSRHLGMNIGPWYVEIHGSLRTGLATRVDREVDMAQRESFQGGRVRIWDNGGVPVTLPAQDEDVFFVFTHFVKHFYKEGMNLRQLCDWCRLLWKFRGEIDCDLLEMRLRRAGLMDEWRGFAAVAVEYLGMKEEAMPLYIDGERWRKKAGRIMDIVLDGGRKGVIRYWFEVARVFPGNAVLFFAGIVFNVNGMKVGERVRGK